MASATIEPSANPAESLCFMAIELSKAKWLIGMLTPLSNKISLRSIPCGAVPELLDAMDDFCSAGARERSCSSQNGARRDMETQGRPLARVLKTAGYPFLQNSRKPPTGL
jgi:hypothetical protein